MRVTVTCSAVTFDGPVLKVFAVKNGTEAGGAYACTGGYSGMPFSMTPNYSGSVIVEAVSNTSAATAPTPSTNDTTSDSGVLTHDGYWDGYYSGTVTAGTPITTLGGTSIAAWGTWAAYEVRPNGTPAIDASTPAVAAVAGGNSSVQTTAFSPPAGAVLVAFVISNDTGAQSFAVTDSSGLGLTWTQRGTTYVVDYTGSTALFTTTIPSTAAAMPAYIRQGLPQALVTAATR